MREKQEMLSLDGNIQAMKRQSVYPTDLNVVVNYIREVFNIVHNERCLRPSARTTLPQGRSATDAGDGEINEKQLFVLTF